MAEHRRELDCGLCQYCLPTGRVVASQLVDHMPDESSRVTLEWMTTSRFANSPSGKQRAIVGTGLTSDVLEWDQGHVLKLYRPGLTREKVELEFRATRAIHAAGLPVPAVFEILEADGRVGIVMERIVGTSLLRHVQTRPWKFLGAVRQLADLHVQIHECRAPAELPPMCEWIGARIAGAQNVSEADKQKALDQLSKLPTGDTLCHGDFHPENVIWAARGPIIIDWETATRGHPLGDVACTVHLMRKASLPARSPLHAKLLLKCARRLIHRTYLSRYLELSFGSRKEIDAWQFPLDIAGRR